MPRGWAFVKVQVQLPVVKFFLKLAATYFIFFAWSNDSKSNTKVLEMALIIRLMHNVCVICIDIYLCKGSTNTCIRGELFWILFHLWLTGCCRLYCLIFVNILLIFPNFDRVLLREDYIFLEEQLLFNLCSTSYAYHFASIYVTMILCI